jgi:hypothetical protein
VAGPATVIGEWLQAIVLGQRDRRDQLARRLSHPSLDDVAVAEAACQRAARRYFGPDNDVRAVTRFAEQLREISGEDLGGGQMETEAVIRSALGEPNLDLSGISDASRFKIHTAAVAFVTGSLRLDESAVGTLLALAETDVFRRGRRPSLAESSSR